MQRNQGEVKFFQRFVFFRDDEEVLSDLGDEAGGSYLGPHKGIALAHGVKIRKLSARGAVRVFPVHFSRTKSNAFNDNTFSLPHNRSIVFDARRTGAFSPAL